jgi:hypothetical protein
LDFYTKLLQAVSRPVFHDGQWSLCQCAGWPDNPSCQNLVAWGWIKDEERYLIAVNLSGIHAQARVRLPWDDCRGGAWSLVDAVSGASYDRDGDEIQDLGLYVAIEPWGCHFLRCCRRHEGLTSGALAGANVAPSASSI